MTDSMDFYPEPRSKLTPEYELQEDLAETTDGDPDETLLDRLDRRQNSVLAKLDQLDARIQALVEQCQTHRGDAA